MGEQLRAPSGTIEWVDDDHLSGAIANGYKPVSDAEASDALTAPEDTEGGIGGGIKAGLSSFASGATLGLSDVALRGLMNRGDFASIQKAREDHPYVSTGAQILGAVAPALLTDGASAEASLAELTPAGFTSRIGSRIAESMGGETTGRIAASAFEGAAQNAGGYISDVALGNRDLSAQGFLGAMGQGMFYGGVGAGALSVAHNGLIAARRLIPAADLTAEGAARAETSARRAIADSTETSTRLESVGRQQLEQGTRETQQFLADLEAERSAALKQAEMPPGEPPAREPFVQGDARQLMKEWRAKYPEGAVDYNAASAAARKGRLAEWAKDFQPANEEDAAIKAYFETNQDPIGVGRPSGLVDVPKAVQARANQLAGEAAHDAYLDAIPKAADVSESGTELMARSMYASRRAAARALDDVYGAYRAGAPIADIQAAASKKLTGQLHELAEARADMIKSLAGKPAVADDLMAQLQGTKAQIDAGGSLGERILAGAKKPIDPDEAVARALGKSKDINTDVADIAPKITRYEAAKAQLTEALGAKAPPEAAAHAQAFRQAQQGAETASARNVAQGTETIDKALSGVPAKALPGGKSIFGKLSKASETLELMRSMGIPVPGLHSIPVVGPLLSAFLKAKIIGKALGMHGGSIGASAEGTIAAKAVQTQNRIRAAVNAMADGAERTTAKAARLTGPMVLAHKLFDDGKREPYTSTPKTAPLDEMYSARLAELAAAQKPGAIERAVRSRINTTDPTIVDSIIAAETTRLTYLYGIAPKPDVPLLPGQPPRPVSKAEIMNFGVVLGAYHDPSAIFERVADGGVARPAEVDCIKNCYPLPYAQAQKQLVEKLIGEEVSIPYARRVAISTLTGIPIDSTMMPDHMMFLSAPLQPSPAAQQPIPPTPHPTLTASVNLGQQTLTRLDR